jgi:hypothetical protein
MLGVSVGGCSRILPVMRHAQLRAGFVRVASTC